MKIGEYAYNAVERLAFVNLRIEAASVPENHRFYMDEPKVERFVYIMSGSVCFSMENETLNASSRDMVYIPHGTKYQSNWLSDAEFVVVDLLLCDADNKEIHFGDAPAILFHDEFCVYDGLLKELARKAEETEPFNWLERTSLCLKLLCDMARESKIKEYNTKESRIKNAIAYIENNFASDFSVDDLAKMTYLSTTYFRRLFFECKGMSPVDYRNSLRITYAAKLIKTGKHTISEVSEMVGIGDIRYFGKIFKRYTGITPGAFKKKLAE